MKKRALSILLALCMAIALLPVPGMAAEVEVIEDTSLNYSSFVNDLGKVYDLSDGSNTPQTLTYDVTPGGETILIFFKANDRYSDRFLDDLAKESWAKLRQVNIVAVESGNADKAATQAYIQAHDTDGVIDKVYYNPDSNSPAYWYYVRYWVRPLNVGMDDIKTQEDLIEALGTKASDFALPLHFLFEQVGGVTSMQSASAGLASNHVLSIREYLREFTDLPINGLQTEPVITFDPSGGSVSTPSLTAKDGYLPSLPSAERSGYTLQGWWTAPTGGTRIDLKTIFRQDTTVYAHWGEVPGTPVYKDSGVLGMKKMGREEVLRFANSEAAVSMPEQKFDVQPSWTAPYAAGKASDAVLQIMLKRLNAFRTLAGVPTVTLDSVMCNEAHHAAVINAKLGKTTHYPSRPNDMDEAFYRKAWDACVTSNLASGGVTPVMAVDLWVNDSNTLDNMSSVGHRCWMINPSMGKAGFGYVYTGTNGNYVAGKVQDKSARGLDYDFISWPASGYFPDSWFNTSEAWSVNLNPEKYGRPNIDDVVVRVTSEKTGKTWTFSKQTTQQIGSDSRLFFVNSTMSYGLQNGIVFLPLGLTELDGVYNVSIAGLTDVNGQSTSLAYQVNFVHDEHSHTITFDANGGTCDTPAAVTNNRGQLTSLPTPVREGYTFDAWTTAPQGGDPVKTTTVFHQNATVYAYWIKNNADGYQINVGSHAHGTLDITSTRVKEGRGAVVNVHPDEGYELTSFQVTDSSGKQISVSRVTIIEDGVRYPSYSFTMPGSDVTVNVVFRQASSADDTEKKYAVRVGSYSNGTVVCPASTVKAGESAVIHAYPKENYELSSVTVTDSSGKQIDTSKASSTSYSFAMPKDNVTINVAFIPAGSESSRPKFTDVPSNGYYAEAVEWAAANEITAGTSATSFSPEGSCTRAQMVTFLWRAAGSPTYTGTTRFRDVQPGSYYYSAVLWAVANGITTGTSGDTFSPDGLLNRAQTVTFLYRLAGTPPCSSKSNFTDVKAGEYYSDAVDWAVANNITNGTSNTTFSPLSSCTRGQIVTFLWRYMG